MNFLSPLEFDQYANERMSTMIDIGPGTMVRERDDLVVVRFNPGSIAGPASLTASFDARREHYGNAPHGLIIFAPDDCDFDPSILGKDQYQDRAAEDFTLALAFVCRNPTVTNILELYFAHHPPPFPVRFFTLEEEARNWMDGSVKTPLV